VCQLIGVIMNKRNIALTRKELAEICKCPYYIIDYLRNLGKLPIHRAGKTGRPTLYLNDSIEVVKDHIRNRVSNG